MCASAHLQNHSRMPCADRHVDEPGTMGAHPIAPISDDQLDRMLALTCTRSMLGFASDCSTLTTVMSGSWLLCFCLLARDWGSCTDQLACLSKIMGGCQ